MDFVADLGPAFVAHRLRRLSDQIVDQIAGAMQVENLTVPPRSASTILLLAQHGPMGPVDIARTLRFSHPLLVRALRVLEDRRLVQTFNHDGDQRRHLVELTDRGRAEAGILLGFNERLNRVVVDVLERAGAEPAAFLDTLDAISRVLDRQSISTRLATKVDI